MMKNETIALAAMMAGKAAAGDDVAELIFADNEQAAHFADAAVKYLAAAPSARPADVQRFGAAKGLHLIPAPTPNEALSEEIVTFFSAFTGAAKGMLAANAPKPSAATVQPAAAPARFDNALTERVGDDEDGEGRSESL
ncbi:MAG TPA: hypothetical protein VKU03_10565, partial [Roseiarcus sp.]|nr:hypothetical protein [Roseiarcus sp.]